MKFGGSNRKARRAQQAQQRAGRAPPQAQASAELVNVHIMTVCRTELNSDFTLSLLRAKQDLLLRGYCTRFTVIDRCSMLPHGRAQAVNYFLSNEGEKGEYLVFIDSDMTFTADDIAKLVEAGEDVVGSVAATFASDGSDQTRVALRPIVPTHLKGRLFEVVACGFGLICIRRAVFARLQQAYPQALFRDPWSGVGNVELYDFFPVGPSQPGGTYISEDYAFCGLWRAIGGRVWVHRDVRPGHMKLIRLVASDAQLDEALSGSQAGAP